MLLKLPSFFGIANTSTSTGCISNFQTQVIHFQCNNNRFTSLATSKSRENGRINSSSYCLRVNMSLFTTHYGAAHTIWSISHHPQTIFSWPIQFSSIYSSVKLYLEYYGYGNDISYLNSIYCQIHRLRFLIGQFLEVKMFQHLLRYSMELFLVITFKESMFHYTLKRGEKILSSWSSIILLLYFL